MSDTDLSWSIPIMRAGYAGRALVYVVVAGFSLYAISKGGEAQGTSAALESLESTTWGGLVLFLVFAGMLSYAIWRLIDATWDLEDYGTDGEGAVARTGMIVTGLIHMAIGILALTLLFSSGGGSDGGGSSIGKAVRWVMELPGGRWIVGLGGLITLGAGGYYLKKAVKEEYLDSLRANRFTENWNFALKAGLAAQGIVVAIIGGLFIYAAYIYSPEAAGGLDKAFGWLSRQPYGRILVGGICVGLLMFALFCAVNAMYRIIPKVAGDDIETLGRRVRAKAQEHAPS